MKVFKDILWSVKIMYNYNRYYIVFSAINAITGGFMPVIALFFTQLLLNMIQLNTGNLETLLILTLIIAGIELLNDLFSYVIASKKKIIETRFGTYIQVEILNKASSLSCKTYEECDTQNLISRVEYDSENSIISNISNTFSLLSATIGIMAYIYIIGKYSFIILFLAFLIPVAQFHFEKYYNTEEIKVRKANTERNRKAEYIYWLLLNPDYVRELKLFDIFSKLISKYKNIKHIYNELLIENTRRRTFSYSICLCIEYILNLLISAFLVINTFKGNLLIGQFVLLNNAVTNINRSLSTILSLLAILCKNSLLVEQYFLFQRLPEECEKEDDIVITDINEIKLENVSYTYRNKNEKALNNINMTLKKGNRYILLGRNGSGKTTLLKIIMGLYIDYEGQIYINGIDLKKINIKSYRMCISSLFQTFIRYETSVKDNIYINDCEYSEKECKYLLNDIGLKELCDNVFQPVGYQFNNGRQLSMGQWQKLANLRALVRRANVYIFDEPNAALDIYSENEIFRQLEKYTENEISICTLHRFNNYTMNSDYIFVMEAGQISEEGNHEKLIDYNGYYSKLYKNQLKYAE